MSGSLKDAMCFGCKGNFHSGRFKCLQCMCFNLCGNCYYSNEAGFGITKHDDHPFQRILTPKEQEIYFQTDSGKPEQWESFVCPICGQLGLTAAAFCDHMRKKHENEETLRDFHCPLCLITHDREGGSNRLIGDICLHVQSYHCSESGAVTIAPSIQPSIPPPPEWQMLHGDSAFSSSPETVSDTEVGNSGQARVDSFPRDSNSVTAYLLAHLEAASRNPRAQPAPRTIPEPEPTYAYPEAVHGAEEDIRSWYSVSTGHTSCELAETATNTELARTVDGLSIHGEERGLLRSLLKPKLSEEELCAIEVERANRALFVQELLWSTLFETHKESADETGPVDRKCSGEETDDQNVQNDDPPIAQHASGDCRDVTPGARQRPQ